MLKGKISHIIPPLKYFVEKFNMENHYQESWKLYRALTSDFTDDLDFYSKFCDNNKVLELFAGFGRLSNHLVDKGVDLTTVELSSDFADYIHLPNEKNFVCDVLEFSSDTKFDVVLAAYNSFCLLLDQRQISKFFSLLDSWLNPGGLVVLSYYHPDYWQDAAAFNFVLDGKTVNYRPKFDLSKRYKEKLGVWVDEFNIEGCVVQHEYPTRIYESEVDLEIFLKGINLELKEIVKDFGIDQVMEPGWIDFILEK